MTWSYLGRWAEFRGGLRPGVERFPSSLACKWGGLGKPNKRWKNIFGAIIGCKQIFLQRHICICVMTARKTFLGQRHFWGKKQGKDKFGGSSCFGSWVKLKNISWMFLWYFNRCCVAWGYKYIFIHLPLSHYHGRWWPGYKWEAQKTVQCTFVIIYHDNVIMAGVWKYMCTLKQHSIC